MVILGIFGIIVLWIVLGFTTFIWNAKRIHLSYFDQFEFVINIVFAPICFLVLICMVLYEKFCDFMENLLQKINK